MSNSQVGKVYDHLINAIIDASRVDFEERGVDLSTLEALKEGWQERLVESGVASFPWKEEEPPPKSHLVNPPTLLSNVGQPGQRSNLNQSQGSSLPQPSFEDSPIKTEIKQEIKTEHIKTEPSQAGPYTTSSNGHSVNPALSNSHSASHRANKLVMEKFGPNAVNHSANPQQGLMMPGQQRQGLQLPGQGQAQPQNTVPQMPPYQQQHQARPGTEPAQTDGTNEDPAARWASIMKTRHGDDQTSGEKELDAQLATYIRERGKSLDDGGIMITLDEHKSARRSRKRKLANLVANNPDAGSESAMAALSLAGLPFLVAAPSTIGRVSTHDGGDDSEVESKNGTADEDAINSDLDDPEEDLDNEDDDDSSMDMMLCMYEKVQRVKNKWKCTLKDGVLTVNKKE
ncbi:MAG: transcription factor IIA subunit alpha [Vezdaea aestivalis]|nr:MAG: transcription factor IIA subunit alpha [Vezdaea aestivalis]